MESDYKQTINVSFFGHKYKDFPCPAGTGYKNVGCGIIDGRGVKSVAHADNLFLGEGGQVRNYLPMTSE